MDRAQRRRSGKPQSEFERTVERSPDQGAEGDWRLEVFTVGDHDDGVAWATTEPTPPEDASSFSASVSDWSQSESFAVLQNLVAYLGPGEPSPVPKWGRYSGG